MTAWASDWVNWVLVGSWLFLLLVLPRLIRVCRRHGRWQGELWVQQPNGGPFELRQTTRCLTRAGAISAKHNLVEKHEEHLSALTRLGICYVGREYQGRIGKRL